MTSSELEWRRYISYANMDETKLAFEIGHFKINPLVQKDYTRLQADLKPYNLKCWCFGQLNL